MKADELRQKYLNFFQSKGHKIIPSAPLVPENDPTTLFVSAGMQPMLPYLLGKPSPYGPKVTDSQKCIRTGDIDEVGDNRHQTFFEMLGNWSFGDYFKKEQLPWIFEFLIKEIGLDPNRIYVTVFAGDEKYNLPKDTESAKIWKDLFAQQNIEAKEVIMGSEENAAETGMQEGRIFYYNQKKNWWSRSSTIDKMPEGEPGGPNSEMFYEFHQIEHDPKFGKYCHPNCDCGHFLEIGNSVFMQYQKQANGSLKELPKKNVDYGGGLERLAMIDNNQPDVFRTDLFTPIISVIENISGKKYEESLGEFRVIADHLKASTFLILDDVVPSNKLQGYILRRLLRRSMVKIHSLSGKVWNTESVIEIIKAVFGVYNGLYETTQQNQQKVFNIVTDELNRFTKTLNQGLKEIKRIDKIDGKIAFNLFQTYGFPLELTEELAQEKGLKINREEFKKEFEKHKELSRTASAGMFKGGLGDQSEVTTKYHTATHLLHAALRKVLGEHVQQKGSNITEERLRFDFSHSEKLTDEELKKVESLVNEKIKESLPVTREEMSKDEALKSGALGFFVDKYGDRVSVYTIGGPSTQFTLSDQRESKGSETPFSREICGGPHVQNTGVLGKFTVTKEESVSAGIRRIYATLV